MYRNRTLRVLREQLAIAREALACYAAEDSWASENLISSVKDLWMMSNNGYEIAKGALERIDHLEKMP